PARPGPHGRARPGHRRVLPVQEVDNFERRRHVDALSAGVALLGEPRVAVVGNGHEGCRMAPKLDIDPNSGQCAQFCMRRSVGLGLLLLTACGGGIKAPETIPVPPVPFVPLTPVDTAPAEGTPASPAAAGTQDARTA